MSMISDICMLSNLEYPPDKALPLAIFPPPRVYLPLHHTCLLYVYPQWGFKL